MSDLVEREAVVQTIEDAKNAGELTFARTIKRIMELPSVTVRQTGEWIAQDIHNCHTDFKCSECGYIHNFMHLYGEPIADYTYCPNCGAKMD